MEDIRPPGLASLAFAALLCLAAPAVACAGEPAGAAGAPTAPAKAPPSRETVFSLTVKGGWLMIPIGICSVLALTWTIERLISLRRAKTMSPGLLERIFEALPPRGKATREHVAAAERLCDEQGSVVARVLRVGVEKFHRDEGHAQTFLEEAATKEVHLLKRSLRMFEICVSVAPLLGLLGTIFGMISCFERSSVADSAARAETLATGIYEALVTTAAGLCVAIPTLVAHHYFLGRIDRIQDAIEEDATEFLDRYYGSQSAVRARPGAPRAAPAPAAEDSPQPIGTET